MVRNVLPVPIALFAMFMAGAVWYQMRLVLPDVHDPTLWLLGRAMTLTLFVAGAFLWAFGVNTLRAAFEEVEAP